MASTRNQRRIYRNGGTPAVEDATAPGEGDAIERTIDVWQKHTDRKLTREDGREIIENMTGFLKILQEWDRVERMAETEAKPAPERQARKSVAAKRVHTGTTETSDAGLTRS